MSARAIGRQGVPAEGLGQAFWVETVLSGVVEIFFLPVEGECVFVVELIGNSSFVTASMSDFFVRLKICPILI